MMYSQCLYYALDKWVEVGGCLKLARSTHWCIPHVLHETKEGVTTHFAPPTDLKAPWYSLAGFRGQVYIEDKDAMKREPPTLICMLIGTIILFVFGGIWATKRIIRNIYDICRKC